MKAKVTQEGVTIPKQMLPEVGEVEICRQGGMIFIMPLPEEAFESGRARDLSIPNARVQPKSAACPDPATNLAERQYRLARQYPGDYVVLVGEQVVHHSGNRDAAFRAYDDAFAGRSAPCPVLVEPNAAPKRTPVLRGHALQRLRLR
jgi:hypothetical protein